MNFALKKIQLDPLFLNRWFIAACTVSITGIFFSRAMISIGMIGIVLLYPITLGWNKPFSFHRKDLVWFFLAPVFVLYAIGLCWTEDMGYGGDRIQVKIPLLFLPLGFWSVKDIITRKTIDTVLFIFICLAFATAAGSFMYYLIHYTEITESYKHAKTIPTIIPHIRYSLMLVLACFAAAQLYRLPLSLPAFVLKKVVPVMGIFLFLFLHILSVRSGLLALYATALVWIVVLIFNSRNKKILLLIPASLAVPILMYVFVPTLQNKVLYMMRDIEQFTSGKSVNNYSDGNRLLSMKIGAEIGLEHFWVGVGSGDVQQSMNAVYRTDYPDMEEKNWLIPHNQFVYVFTALGSIGLVLFVLCLIYPILVKEIMTDLFCIAVLVSVYTSFLSEATLEVQHGVALISFFFCLSYMRVVRS